MATASEEGRRTITGAFRLDVLRPVVREAFAIEERGVDVRSGIAGAIAVAGPLAVGVAAGDIRAGVVAAIGGLNTALCVPRAGVRDRWWWGTVALAGSVGSLVLADLVGPTTWLLLVGSFLWVGLWALARGAGRTGALVGFATSAVFVVLAGIPPGGESLAVRGWWFLAGGVPALLLMVLARRPPSTPAAPVAAAPAPAAPVPAAPAPAAPTPAAPADAAPGARARTGGRAALSAIRDGVAHDDGLRAHALRLAIAVTAGTALAHAAGFAHSYWVPLTVLAIVQPGEHATTVRAVQRAGGTLVGIALIVVVTLITDASWALVACAAFTAFWLYALDERGYFWLVVTLTPTVLLLLSVADFEGTDIALQRTLDSGVGIVVGLLIGEIAWRLGPRHDLR